MIVYCTLKQKVTKLYTTLVQPHLEVSCTVLGVTVQIRHKTIRKCTKVGYKDVGGAVGQGV